MGGLYGAVAEFVSALERPLPVRAVGIPDRYIAQGTQEELREECGYNTDELIVSIKKEWENFYKKAKVFAKID